MLRTEKLNDSWGYTDNASPLRQNDVSTLWHEGTEEQQQENQPIGAQELNAALGGVSRNGNSESSSSSSDDDDDDEEETVEWPTSAGTEGPTNQDDENTLMMF